MEPLITTIILASVLVTLAVLGLAIGYLITGKSKIQPGACGRDPNKKKEKNCGDDVSCSLCDHDKK